MAFLRVRDRKTGQQKPMSLGMANALRDKYEIITDGFETGGGVQEVKIEVAPNVEAATGKVADAGEGVELAAARAKYEELYGKKPHGRLKLETLQKLIAEKDGQA